MAYLTNIGIAFTRFLNTVVGGHYAESTSAHAWRQRHKWQWNCARIVIDWLFWTLAKQVAHCQTSYEKEQERGREYLAFGETNLGTNDAAATTR